MSLSEAQEVLRKSLGTWSPVDLNNAAAKIRRVVILRTLWYPEIMQGLTRSARSFLHGVGITPEQIIEIEVPGSFELPLAALQQVGACDFMVALGCVIQGGTPHFEYVCQAVTQGLMQVQLQSKIPIGFGVLTVNDLAQAELRKDKGAEAAQAAFFMHLNGQKRE